MRAIVLAGGHNDALGPLTFDNPVAALPVAGKPLVARLLDYLEGQGIVAAIVSCYRWPHLVERAAQQRCGRLPVATAFEHPPLGSANVVRQLASHLDDTFVVVTGDVLTDLDLRAALRQHSERGAMATVVVCDVEPPCRHGEVVADLDGMVLMVGSEKLVRREGRRTASSGIYILEPEVLRLIPRERSFGLERDLLPLLVENDLPVFASHLKGYWRAIDSIDQYRLANLDILDGKVRDTRPDGVETAAGIWTGAGARIDRRAALHPPLLIAGGCRVERDAAIGPNAVLCEGVHVKRGAVVSGSVVLPGSKAGLGTRLEDAVVKGNVLARANSPEPTYVDDRQVLETLDPVDVHALLRSLIDRTAALVALTVLSPLLLLIALLIKLDSRGPVLYSQLRVGQGRRMPNGQYQGRVFELLKFRTMYADADVKLKEVLAQNEYGGAAFVKIRDDPRITRIGRLLRATSLDEWPQFINVLRGDMGLVGNRPLPLYEAERLSDEWQRIRFSAPAGVTGLWQISGRSDLSAEERIVLDNYYALTHSFWGDVKILLVTIPALLARRGAR